MTGFGYTLMTEQNGPEDLVRNAISAERRGFDFEVATDHFAPWLASQGHAPNAWAVPCGRDLALVRIGTHTQQQFLKEAAEPLLAALRSAA